MATPSSIVATPGSVRSSPLCDRYSWNVEYLSMRVMTATLRLELEFAGVRVADVRELKGPENITIDPTLRSANLPLFRRPSMVLRPLRM